nr:MAG TPA: hypothetical protein [Caudoviricetes sp.]
MPYHSLCPLLATQSILPSGENLIIAVPLNFPELRAVNLRLTQPKKDAGQNLSGILSDRLAKFVGRAVVPPTVRNTSWPTLTTLAFKP